MHIDFDVLIAMDDGVLLRADIFRPEGADRVPAIITYGPYAKGLHFEDGYPTAWKLLTTEHPEVLRGTSARYMNWETVDPERWVPFGYACVRVDSRGAGRSQGRLDPYSPREARDYHDCIEWVARQPWSNRRVGISGVSYYASNAWTVAALQPPHLAAICVWEGAADFYRDCNYHGGILSTFLLDWYGNQVMSVQHGLGDRAARSRVTGESVAGPEQLSDEELEAMRADFPADIKAHPLADDWFRVRSPDFSRVKAPLLSAGNWGGQGFHLRGNVEGFVRSASTQKWLELHINEHWTDFYTDYGVDLQKRFFDHFLKGEANGWANQPRVQYIARHVDGTGELRHCDQWPPEDVEWQRFHLQAETRSLSRSASSPGSATFAALEEKLEFVTDPLDRPFEICGPVSASLTISSTMTDADIFLVLNVIDPEGEPVLLVGTGDPHTPIGQGWLRASHRKLDPDLTLPYRPYHSHDEPWPLEPGKPCRLEIEIWPTSIIVPPGYRLSLSVQGTDFDYGGPGVPLSNFSRPMRGCGPLIHDDPDDRPASIFGGRTTLHMGGAHECSLLLPTLQRG